MPFSFSTPLANADSSCNSQYTRSFQHIDWIDGESVVQAEQTPTEDGFNERFHRIEADLDAAAGDAATSIQCVAALRSEVAILLNELRNGINEIWTAATPNWTTPALVSGWQSRAPDTDFDYSIAGFYKDIAGNVFLKGVLRDGIQPSNGNRFRSTIFTLPVGFRPDRRKILKVVTSGDAVVRLDITEDGDVDLRGAYSSYISLDGLTFRVGS